MRSGKEIQDPIMTLNTKAVNLKEKKTMKKLVTKHHLMILHQVILIILCLFHHIHKTRNGILTPTQLPSNQPYNDFIHQQKTR